MPCYHPIPAGLITLPGGGKKITLKRGTYGSPLSLPCSKCVGCRLERARQWAVRLMHEAQLHEASSFITLTYDPEFLPKDGSISVVACQSFMKRLRARIAPQKIRFFMCGEYGSKLQRPHYHALIFGFDFPDRVPLKDDLFRSDLLDSVWGQGFCSIGQVTFDSACYVAKYQLKQIGGKKAKAHYCGKRPEFVLMSRRPGIGSGWFEKFQSDVYPEDNLIVKGWPTRPPRYYDKKFAEIAPEAWQKIVVAREEANAELEEVLDLERLIIEKEKVGPNVKRLLVREKVAKAKASLKRRKLERE